MKSLGVSSPRDMTNHGGEGGDAYTQENQKRPMHGGKSSLVYLQVKTRCCH